MVLNDAIGRGITLLRTYLTHGMVLRYAAVVLAASVGFAVGITTASAQMGDPGLGERVWRELSTCAECHGWAGDGVPDIPQRQGANLRESLLTPEMVFEVIRCGRPGTAMPSFRRNTWSEIIPCYGMIAPMGGALQPVRSDSPLSDRFTEALVAFVFQDFIGQGPVSREYCEDVFSAGNPRCAPYPTEAELAAGALPVDPAAVAPAPAGGH